MFQPPDGLSLHQPLAWLQKSAGWLAAVFALIGAWAVIAPAWDLPWLVAEPVAATGAVQDAINTGIKAFVAWAKPVLRMVSDGINWAVRGLSPGFTGCPGPVLW